jgi:hypothetical protein
MFDLGDTVPLGVDIKNAAGALTNASTIALTITLPDGTSSAPTPTNPSTGRYEYDYTTAQAGRHLVRWVATTPYAAYTDVFDVRSAAGIGIVSLADAKNHLNITTTTHDEELRGFVDTVTDLIEHVSGSVIRRSVVETHSGAYKPALLLRQPPVMSIASVTENGTTLAATDYSLDADAGLLYRMAGAYLPSRWRAGVKNIVVTYLAGRASVPAPVREAALDLIRINWRPQQGGNFSPFDGGRGDDAGAAQVRLGFFVPNRVAQLLAPSADPGGFA